MHGLVRIECLKTKRGPHLSTVKLMRVPQMLYSSSWLLWSSRRSMASSTRACPTEGQKQTFKARNIPKAKIVNFLALHCTRPRKNYPL